MQLLELISSPEIIVVDTLSINPVYLKKQATAVATNPQIRFEKSIPIFNRLESFKNPPINSPAIKEAIKSFVVPKNSIAKNDAPIACPAISTTVLYGFSLFISFN